MSADEERAAQHTASGAHPAAKETRLGQPMKISTASRGGEREWSAQEKQMMAIPQCCPSPGPLAQTVPRSSSPSDHLTRRLGKSLQTGSRRKPTGHSPQHTHSQQDGWPNFFSNQCVHARARTASFFPCREQCEYLYSTSCVDSDWYISLFLALGSRYAIGVSGRICPAPAMHRFHSLRSRCAEPGP